MEPTNCSTRIAVLASCGVAMAAPAQAGPLPRIRGAQAIPWCTPATTCRRDQAIAYQWDMNVCHTWYFVEHEAGNVPSGRATERRVGRRQSAFRSTGFVRLLLVSSARKGLTAPTDTSREQTQKYPTRRQRGYLRLLAARDGRLLRKRNQLLAHQVWTLVDDEVRGVDRLERVVVGLGGFGCDDDGEPRNRQCRIARGSEWSSARLGIPCSVRVYRVPGTCGRCLGRPGHTPGRGTARRRPAASSGSIIGADPEDHASRRSPYGAAANPNVASGTW